LYKNDDNSLNNSDYFINEKFIIEDL